MDVGVSSYSSSLPKAKKKSFNSFQEFWPTPLPIPREYIFMILEFITSESENRHKRNP